MPFAKTQIDTPLGVMEAEFDSNGALRRLLFMPIETAEDARPASEDARPELAEQLRQYFSGERRELDFPLVPEGTEFQKRVWQELRRIPLGETISYAELARRIGYPSAVRAVARANALNPIAILIPCHRVIGSDGSLTGYAWGLERKERLLALEGAPCGAAMKQISISFFE